MSTNESARRAVAAILLCVCATVFWSVGHSHAQDPTVVVDETTLLKGDDGTTTLSAELTITGIEGPVVLSTVINGAADSDCIPDAQPIVKPGVAKVVSLKFPAGCNLSGDVVVEFIANALDNDAAATNTVTVKVGDSPSTEPNFAPLGMYVLAAGFAGAVVFLARYVGSDDAWDDQGTDGKKNWLGRTLPGLTSSWKLGDSWASNVTLAAAVFTGVFGTSDVLESILGEDNKSQVAVAVIAAALSAGLVGAAPIVLAVLRRGAANSGVAPSAGQALPINYTTSGVVAASWLVLTANLGVVATLTVALSESDPIADWLLAVTACAASALLTVYVARSLRRTLREGVIPAPDASSQDGTGGPAAEGHAERAGWPMEGHIRLLAPVRTSAMP